MVSKALQLEGEKIFLRRLSEADATPAYVSWLNDPEVNQYLESRFITQTLEGVKEYIRSTNQDQRTVFLAIARKDTGKHIGNIKLGPIDPHHKHGEIGIMIGDKASWGQGIATEAIQLLVNYAFTVLGLHKLSAGAYAGNLGSVKSFLKVGFTQEGQLRQHYRSGEEYVDAIQMGLVNTTS